MPKYGWKNVTIAVRSSAQRFHSAAALAPASGISPSHAGACGIPPFIASLSARSICCTSSAPPGAANASGNTTTTAVISTISSAALAGPSRSRSRSAV